MNTHVLSICRDAARRLLAITLCVVATGAGAQHYSFSFLPHSSDAHGGLYDSGNGINDAGHVVGTVVVTHERYAQLWTSPTTPISLPPLAANTQPLSSAFAINNAGWIVGEDDGRSVLWINNQPTLLAVGARGLNNSGQIVGITGEHAALWDKGKVTDLGTLGGSAFAEDINNRGMAVGSSELTSGGDLHATLWYKGAITDLGAPGNLPSEATAINDRGQVVGHSDDRATLWEHGSPTYLSSIQSRANGINNRGQVVGSTTVFDADTWLPSTATLWDHGTAIDLTSFLSQSDRDAGWVLETANAINNAGWITGSVVNKNDGPYGGRFAYLLAVTPVPEATTLTLWLAGLGVLGIASRLRESMVIA